MNTIPHVTEDAAVREALGRVKVLYTDLDGTLLGPGGSLLLDGEGRFSLTTASAIIALAQAGLTVVPVSGRTRSQLNELARLVSWPDYIAEAGAVLVHGVGGVQEVRYNRGVWDESADEGLTPFEVIARSGAVGALIAAFPGKIEPHTPWHLNREATHLLRGCLDVAEAQEMLDAYGLPIAILDNGLVRNAGTLTCAGGQRPHAYHLVPKGVDKAQAVALDLAWRGLDASQAAAIGDSATDIQMASSVAVMTLVANAFEGHGVRDALASRQPANLAHTNGARGDGWAEFARAWLSAR